MAVELRDESLDLTSAADPGCWGFSASLELDRVQLTDIDRHVIGGCHAAPGMEGAIRSDGPAAMATQEVEDFGFALWSLVDLRPE